MEAVNFPSILLSAPMLPYSVFLGKGIVWRDCSGFDLAIGEPICALSSPPPSPFTCFDVPPLHSVIAVALLVRGVGGGVVVDVPLP